MYWIRLNTILIFYLISVTSSLSAQNPLKLLSPQNGGTYADTTLILKWKKVENATSYDITIAYDTNFDSVFFFSTISTNSDTVYNIAADMYYWKCKANMPASQVFISPINSFSVISLSNVSTLKLWWDASDSVIKEPGNKISRWIDKSGNGNDGLQTDGLKQPIFQDSVINNYAVVRFDGLTQAIKANPFSLSPPAQLFMIYNKPVNGSNEYLFDGGGINRFRLSVTASNAYLLYAGNFFITSGNAGSVGDKILTVKQGLSESLIRSNMTTIGNGDPGSSAINGFVLGEYGIETTDPDVHSKIDVAEVLIYSDTLTIQRTEDIENYLRYKYAPPVVINSSDIKFFCPVTLFPQKDFISYLWSTGAITKTIDVSTSGIYYLTVQDNFGFISSDTINLLINRPTYPQLNDSVLCVGNTITWDTQLPKSTYTFQWQDNSTDSVFTISSAGQYWVKITDTSGCSGYSDTITITVDNFPSIVSLGNDTSLCSGNSIGLKTGASQATSYLWSDNSTNNSLAVTSSGQYWVTVNNINSCSKTDTVNITIAGSAPTANFSSGNTCFGKSTQFNDLSVPPGGDVINYWEWDFGDASSSAAQNPSHIYADTGSYIVKLLVKTNAGCGAILSKTVKVYPYPQISFTTNNLCKDAATQFLGQATIFGYPITQWSWNFGDPTSGVNNISASQNPVHIYANPATYTVQLIAQNTFGCADTATKNIVIGLLPIADFNYSLACKNSSVRFTDNSTLPASTNIQSTIWDFGDNGVSSLLNPTHIYSSNVNYTVTHIITASNGCKDTAIKILNVYPAPYAYFSADNACVNALINFTDLSVALGGTITGWVWDFGNADTSMIQNAKHTFTTIGSKNIKLIVTTLSGCKDSITQTVVVKALPIPNFTFTPLSGTAPLLVNFTNTTSGAITYIWDFGDQSQSTMVNPTHTYLSTGNYQISLIAKNNFGCEKSVTKMINIFEQYLDIAIIDLSVSMQNNFLNLTAKIANTGNTDITSMEFYTNIKDGPLVKENWTGLLQAANIISYNLTSSTYLENEKDVVCVSVLKPNGVDDEVSENNKFCRALDESEFKALTPYPNPSKDILTLPFIIPDERKLTITIYNANGNVVKNAYSGYLGKGLQLVIINTVELTSGLYACRIEYENQTVVKTFIKQ